MKCNCNQCGHNWAPRASMRGTPSCCPRCKRYDWMEPKKGQRSSSDESYLPQNEIRREVVAGRTKPSKVPKVGIRARTVPVLEPAAGVVKDRVGTGKVALDDEPTMKLCRACESACIITKQGFWACNDASCSMYGQQQGKVPPE